MQLDYFKMLLNGLFVLALLSQVTAKPAGDDHSSEDTMPSDDYQYNDDEDAMAVAQKGESTAPSSKTTSAPFFAQKEVVRLAQLGQNITLECAVKNSTDTNVIIWYKDTNAITTGKTVSGNTEKYAIPSSDVQNFSLNVINVTQADLGNYYCEVQPGKIRMHTILQLGKDELPAVTKVMPEQPPKEVADFVQKASADAASSSSMLHMSLICTMFAGVVQSAMK